MVSFLSKILVLILFSFLIIMFYYSFPAHKENFDGYISFVLIISIVYSVYKYFKFLFSGDKLIFSILELINYFLIILFIVCFLFFSYNGLVLSNTISLFFTIVFYIIVPFSIVFISTGFGNKIVNLLKIDKKGEEIFSFLLSLGLGLFSFISLLFIIGLIGFYNIYSVVFILIFFLVMSYKNIGQLFNGLSNYKIRIDNHILDSDSPVKKIGLYILSSEFLFIVASLIISINFLSIIRPMPIGWDDLGAYMNFPRQMVHAEDITFLGGMYAWQIFTGIGYMISEPIQAFFMNNVGGILSFIVIILVVSDLIKTDKKRFINIPLLLATVFISMPMIVFQQAKDMKLDSGLFFITLIVIYLVYKVYFLDYFVKKTSLLNKIRNSLIFFEGDNKKMYIFLFLIGLLTGFAFAVKFTSMMLIISIIAVIFYSRLGGLGFLGYLLLFITVFTKFGLWTYLNIDYSNNDLVLVNLVSIFSLIGSILFFVGAIKRYSIIEFKKSFIHIIIFILGILLALSPWIYKNITQSNYKISISSILSGKQKGFIRDYTKIYNENELKELKNEIEKNKHVGKGDEDHLRYFGYEKGINNYVKLPWNLTMQTNQGGEFTNIGWLFLALLPGIFLFLPYRRKSFSIFPIILIITEILLFVIPDTRLYFTQVLGNIDLPMGYLLILIMFLLPILYFLFALKNTRLTTLFKLNLIFTSLYTFLWTISAYGIVWYGIMMYFGFLFMIGLGMYYIISYDEKENEDELFAKLFSSVIIFGIFLVWFFMSVFPHSFNNLKNAGYPNMKAGILSQNELIFLYHSDYLTILYSLNISKDKKLDFIDSTFKDEQLKLLAKPYLGDLDKLNLFLRLVEKGEFSKVLPADINKQLPKKLKNTLKKSAHDTKNRLYSGILKPLDKYKNNDGIYRVGTFLKYFISGNDHRLYEDSLLKGFSSYFNNKNSDIVVDRMKKIGINYLLVDLNAATIDKDPKHNLTKKYEDLLVSFTSDKLKLINSDSICLKLAKERYSYSNKTDEDLEKYLKIAFVNSESYKDGKSISRGSKLVGCYEEIIKTINSKKVSKDKYNYLIPLIDALVLDSKITQDKVLLMKFLQKNVKAGGKVLFEIK